ncbi:MAG: heavy metal translocating P-type ATPase [Rhodothermales bacterium]|nr:heavy metal translocating P-type ATPase [Rhodothermales bacterium]
MPKLLRIDLPVLLPDVPDARDSCVDRLTGSLQARDGVNTVHLIDAEKGQPVKLCIHYDPDVIPLPRIRQAAIHNGARLTDHFGHVLWDVEGVRHSRRARTVSERLLGIPGVLEAQASAAGKLRVEFDRTQLDEDDLRDAIDRLNVRRSDAPREPDRERTATDDHAEESHGKENHDEDDHDHGGVLGEKTELIFAIASGVCVGLGWGLESFTGIDGRVAFGLFVAGYFFGGFHTLREAVDSVRAGRFEIDFLMLVAAAGAAVLGEWFEGALLLFLFSLGHSLEHYAMGRARKAIESLADLAPETAVVRRGGQETEIPVVELEVGDTVIIRPNERIPADAFVVKGSSAVNQAPVTGESVPVDKQAVEDPDKAAENWERMEAEQRVFAGTINGSGSLEVVVARRSTESTISRVVQMVSEAETEKSPTQRFTDRFERIFVPAVLGFVMILLFAWVVVDETFAASFYRAMAVLVAASPCALAIATPSAVLSGVARAGRGGVLVKGGGPLENLGTLSAIAFDKTGTLTEGQPKVTDVWAAEGVDEVTLLRTVVAVEKLSDHPLAEAVVRYGAERLEARNDVQAEDLESITGRGVRARLNGETVYVGKDDLFREVGGPELPQSLLDRVEQLESDGRTTMIVRKGETYLGILGLMDTPREAATETVKRLREIGIRRMIMISGDNQRVADAVAIEVGLDEARGDLMPDDKVDTIRRLSREEKVAMVGDGVNDAPAMANATVGIAMGAAGSDVALETADVALMADRLEHLPFAVGLSRRTSSVIRQNLWLSLGMVAFLVPATVLGLGIGPAVALHEGSTLVVVINALRLLGYQD